MSSRLARLVIDAVVWLVPTPLRERWREEWLAEIDAAPRSRVTLGRIAGAPWDAFTSRWTIRARPERQRPLLFGHRGELKQAYRSLRRTPWYSLTVIGLIALSMTLATTVFAIVDGMLFKPLPYAQVDRLFGVITGHSRVPDTIRDVTVTQFDVDAWKAALPEATFTAFYSSGGSLPTGTDERIPSARVDESFFDIVGIKPMAGGFAPGDFAAYNFKMQPAVITFGCWIRRFAGDPSVLGRTVIGEDGAGFRIVGILPVNFIFPNYLPVDALTPQVRERTPSRGGYSLHVLARLPPSLSEPNASARLAAAARDLAASWPPSPPRVGISERQLLMSGHRDVVRLQPIRETMTEEWRAASWFRFWAAVLLVLLACVSVSGLGLARVQDRWRELALRRSLGASHADLVRLLAAEFALVTGAGTALGLVAAFPALGFIVSLMSKMSQFLKVPAIDVRVLAFAALTVLACVGFLTLASARVAWRSSLRSAIVEGGASSRRVRGGLAIIAVQVALALVVAVCGALVAGSLIRVEREDSGFDPDRTAILVVNPRVPVAASVAEDLMSDLRRLPGVEHVGGVDKTILDLSFNGNEFDRPSGVPLTTIVESMAMTSDYLAAAGLSPTDGRLPTPAEFESGASVVVVSQIVAREYWPGQRATGQSLIKGGRTFDVVGVVPDARYVSLDEEPQGAIYWPLAAKPQAFPYFTLVRFSPQDSTQLSSVVAALAQRCSTCRLLKVQTVAEAIGVTIRSRRFNAWLFSSFGVAALAIVGAGILGLVAMATNRRTREIGIRMALGATRPGVVRQILREQVLAVVTGFLLGGIVAAWAVQFVSAYLYKTPIYDQWAWASALGALLTVASLGALLPSVRASRVEPVRALRVE